MQEPQKDHRKEKGSKQRGAGGHYIDAKAPYVAMSSSHARELEILLLLMRFNCMLAPSASSTSLRLLSSSASCSLRVRAISFFRFFCSAFSALLGLSDTETDLPMNSHERPVGLTGDGSSSSGDGPGDGSSDGSGDDRENAGERTAESGVRTCV